MSHKIICFQSRWKVILYWR